MTKKEFEKELREIKNIWGLPEIDLDHAISRFKEGYKAVELFIIGPDDWVYSAWAYCDSSIKIDLKGYKQG
jgi:hypothetical protein